MMVRISLPLEVLEGKTVLRQHAHLPTLEVCQAEAVRGVAILKPSGASQFEVLVGRHVEAGYGCRHDVLHARADAYRKPKLIDRCLDDLLVQDALDLVQQRFALLAVKLVTLPGKKIVHLRQCAIGECTALGDERFEARGRVARDTTDSQYHAAQFLLAPGDHEGAPLHALHFCTDAHRRQPSLDRLSHRIVGRERRQLPTIEAARISSIGQELLGADWIERVWVKREREFEVARYDATGRSGQP